MGYGVHPRRPRGLKKTGGRRPGSINRRTAALRAELVAAGASDQETPPFRFLSRVMNDEGLEFSVRCDAAKALLPYTNFRKGAVDVSGISQPLIVQILRFSPEESEASPTMIEHEAG